MIGHCWRKIIVDRDYLAMPKLRRLKKNYLKREYWRLKKSKKTVPGE